jgi:hypothetical protein
MTLAAPKNELRRLFSALLSPGSSSANIEFVATAGAAAISGSVPLRTAGFSHAGFTLRA